MKAGTRRVLFWLVVIFAVFMIITEPETLAAWVRTVVNWIGIAFTRLFDFFEALV